MAQAPAGWYPQPDGTQRYWDGAQWTEHISGTPAAASAPAPAPVAEATPEPAAEPEPVVEPAPAKAKAKAAAKPKAAAATEPTPAEPIAEPAVAEPVVFAGSDMPAPAASSSAPAPAAPISGIPATSAPAKKRKIWPIVVGVIGALVLVFVIAIVAIVFFINKAVSGPQEAVQLYDDAWQNVDCEAIVASTTVELQQNQGYDDCATFESYAQPFADSVIAYDVKITNTEYSNGAAYVTTEEYYLDTDGEESTDTYEYTLEQVDGKWLISNVTSLGSE